MSWLVRATARVQGVLFPFMGPAQVRPVEGQTAPTSEGTCPLCRRPLAAHEFERVAGRPTRMHCPVSPAEAA
jgi:hypothetical protein